MLLKTFFSTKVHPHLRSAYRVLSSTEARTSKMGRSNNNHLSKAREPDSHDVYWSTAPDDKVHKIESLKRDLLKHHPDFGTPRGSKSLSNNFCHPTMTSDGFFIP